MKYYILPLIMALLPALASAQAIKDLAEAAGQEAFTASEITSKDPKKIDWEQVIQDTINGGPQTPDDLKTYETAPFTDKDDAEDALKQIKKNLSNASARIALARVYGAPGKYTASVEFWSNFDIANFERDSFTTREEAEKTLKQVLKSFKKTGVKLIYGQVTGSNGNFSINIDYGNPKSMPTVGVLVGNLIDSIIANSK